MKFGREHIALNAKDSTPTAEANTLQKYSLSSLQYTMVYPARDNIFQDSHRFS